MQYRKFRTVNMILLISILVLALAGIAAAQDVVPADQGELVAEGFNMPQGILLDPDGNVWVIDAGLGGEEEIPWYDTQGQPTTGLFGQTASVYRISGEDGSVETVTNLPSILIGEGPTAEATGGARLALAEDGTLYATSGWALGAPDAEVPDNMANVVEIGADGTVTSVADLWAFEAANNPVPPVYDSHPYGINVGPEGMIYVTDAGGNDLLQVDPETGEVSLVTTFEPLPGVFPRPDYGGEMLTDPVPTDVVFDDAGNAYVSFLSGAPFVPGSAKVVKVAPDGTVSDYTTGLTMVMDLDWGPNGALYAVQFSSSGPEGPTPASGSVVHLVEGDMAHPVIEGLMFPSSLDIDDTGTVYVSVGAVGPPGSGAVLSFPGAIQAGEAVAPEASVTRGTNANPLRWIIGLLVPFLTQ